MLEFLVSQVINLQKKRTESNAEFLLIFYNLLVYASKTTSTKSG